MKKDTSWGSVSSWYDELVEGKNEEGNGNDSYQAKVILPNLIRIVDPHKGLTIFDNACGQGFFSRAFAEKGATVIASDISSELISIAKEKQINDKKQKSVPDANIDYHVTPADKINFLKNESVDVETIVLALQNMQTLQPVFDEAFRVLKPRGRFVFVLNHPAFRIPKQSSWDFDEKNAVQYRRIDGYMSEQRSEIVMHPGSVMVGKQSPKTVSFHRPLQVFVKALAKSGFAITRLEEWISHRQSQSGPRQAAEDKARKEIPLFLCIEAQKRIQ